MAITNTERVGKALDLWRDGLRPFVEREVQSRYSGSAADQIRDILSDTRLGGDRADPLNDIAVLLVVMDRLWGCLLYTSSWEALARRSSGASTSCALYTLRATH